MLGGINRGIDSPAKFMDPAFPAARGVKSVNPRVRTSEKNNSVTDDGRSPDFSSSRRFPQLASGMPIKCIHFAVIASEQDSIFGKRRRGMNLTRRLKFPF